MRRWVFPFKNKKQVEQFNVQQDRLYLVIEIRRAHMEWEVAQKRFDFVVEKDQIDYAIFALEAAEKRFEMLIRQAKNLKISEGEVYASYSVEGSS